MKKKQKECPSCAMMIDNQEQVCPICGYEFPRQNLSVKIGVWILIALMLAWVFF